MKPVRLIEQSPVALAKISAKKSILLIPIGTVEWHAGHLPLGVDSLLSVAICEEISARTGCVVAPLLSCGICRDLSPEKGFFGTVDTIEEKTLSCLIADVLLGYAKMGFRQAILFSGHFEMEHFSAITEGVRNVPSIQTKFLTGLDLTRDKNQDLGDVSLTWPYVGDHAAEWETSLMLYYHPELVHMEYAPETIELDMEGLPEYIRRRYPRRASKAYGRRIRNVMIKCGVNLVRENLNTLSSV